MFSSYPEHKYSFVHIDVDLYEPTYESLKYFAPRMSCHGIIVCDDYGYSMFPGSTRAVELFLEESRAIYNLHVFRPSYGTVVLVFCDH